MTRNMMATMVAVAALASAAWGAVLTPADVKLDGMTVTILPLKTTVTIAPLPAIHMKWDGVLAVGPVCYVGPVMLPGIGWRSGALRPKSLVVTLADDPNVKLVEGVDYAVDWKLWGLGGLAGSAYTNRKCHFEYDRTNTRLDLIEQTADGKVVLKPGVEDLYGPWLPTADAKATPLLSVYLPPNTVTLTMDNINLIDPSYHGVPPVAGTEVLQPARDKIAAGQPVTFVFLGDSITAQTPNEFRDRQGNYIDRFATWLGKAYPKTKIVVTSKDKPIPPATNQIVIVKAGIGGDTTIKALKRFDADVAAHHPDVLSIMLGVNDSNKGGKEGNCVPPAAYKINLETLVDKAHALGASVIIMTPSMKNATWSVTTTNEPVYAAAGRAVAQEKHCCLVDNYRAWQDVGKQGLNYMVLLGTCLNHPIEYGHQLFANGLQAAFEAK